ncbi:AAA family ATPase [Algoriphagus hitonicola]|uniref:Exonuclease SbcC n=1 Tax=Algoriphagus hitonicola TaxID=435880 RepID=A0A1I2UCV8_9BACT|nr:SMC family ATPase [Algoriphagus hitonicola]SFG74982.1 exonuclease SbcC [Algoriphagus hitonicola]
MIPVQLEIQGLYSYREKETIDFEPLTAAGLFGIFGAVGSGKSSILEAILLALYGSTERLSDRGEKNSMVNLQSDQVLIRFIFRSGKNNSQTYLARYEAKRNKKDPEKVDPANHIFYHQVDGNWEALEQKAEEIVGMKKDHFKQTVIIPQGKFREFIDLTPGPRAEMMKELFGLERFDLASKTGSLLRQVKDEKIRLDTKIQSLEEYSEEGLASQNEKLESQKLELKQSSEKVSKLDLAVKSQEKFREKHHAWVEFSQMKRELLNQKPQIEKQRQLHRDFITAKSHLRPVWYQLRDQRIDAEKYRVSIIDCERFAVEFEKELAEEKNQEKELREKNQKRPEREGKIRDLKKVLEIKELKEKLRSAEQELEQILPSITTLQNQRKDLEQKLRESESQLGKLAATDANHLASLKNQLHTWSDLETQLAQKNKLISQFEREERKVSESLNSLLTQIPSEFQQLEDWLKSQQAEIRKWEEKREAILRKSGLHSHAHLLEDGKPCPLCGSIEHPDPLEKSSQNQAQKEIELKISKEKEQLEKILLIRQQLKEQEIYLQNHQENLKRNRQEKSTISDKLGQITQGLAAQDIDNQQTLNEQIQLLENESQIREKTLSDIQKIRQESDQVQKNLDQSQDKVQQAQMKKGNLQTAIQSKQDEIKDRDFCQAFFEKTPEDIQRGIYKVEKDIHEAVLALESKQKFLQELQTKAATNLADLKNFKNSFESAQTKIEKLENEFESLKEEHGFPDEEALIRLFEHSLDAEKIAKEIQQFDQQLALAESRIEELEKEKDVIEFDEEAFVKLAAQHQLTLSMNKELQERVVLLQQEVKTTSQKLEEKKILFQELETVEKRESYLRELEKLFKGSGFVKYVSSIYLKELCHTANQRFMKLSKNSLSLEIDEDNTFWVIDYLNGGKKRLLKTLSGGQTFQASLCLALALAEKVKALNQADQSFFFLDEGFGALDRNSLRVVFETLKSLRHENRIVGIISHVEELQQEIGVYAQVELDPETGSKVSYSY